MPSKAGEVNVTAQLKSFDLRTSGTLIAELSRHAAGVEIVNLPGDGRKALIHNFAAGTYEILDVAPDPRDHALYSVDSFVDIARHFQAREESNCRVWHGHQALILLCDDDDRRDLVTLGLLPSEPLTWLRDLAASAHAMTQAALIRVLRLKLGQPTELVGKFRRLDFSGLKKGVTSVEHGKESLGREITAAVQGVETLPEVLDVSVPITNVPGANAPQVIRLGLEIDAQREEFYLAPLPGELEGAVERMHADLHERLTSMLDGVPVYYGAP